MSDRDGSSDRNTSQENHLTSSHEDGQPVPHTPVTDDKTCEAKSTGASSRRNSLRKVPSFTSSKSNRRSMLTPSPTISKQNYHEYYHDVDDNGDLASRMQSRDFVRPLASDMQSLACASNPQVKQDYSPPTDKQPVPSGETWSFQDHMVRTVKSTESDDFSIQVPTYDTMDEKSKDDQILKHIGKSSDSTNLDEFSRMLTSALEKEIDIQSKADLDSNMTQSELKARSFMSGLQSV